MIRSVLAFLVLALPAAAETPLGAAEFDAYTRGKTLYFGRDGRNYGVERYLDDRRVRWSFLDGRCKEGIWFERDAGLICFVYEDEPAEHCWRFFARSGQLIAQFGDEPDAQPLYETAEDDDGMLCYGPDVGA